MDLLILGASMISFLSAADGVRLINSLAGCILSTERFTIGLSGDSFSLRGERIFDFKWAVVRYEESGTFFLRSLMGLYALYFFYSFWVMLTVDFNRELEADLGVNVNVFFILVFLIFPLTFCRSAG